MLVTSLRERRRILVVGSGGAGKSTFARRLGELTGLPVVHLDRHFWRAGWKATPTDEWNTTVAQLAATPEWIMDGNFGGSQSRLPERMSLEFLLWIWRYPRRSRQRMLTAFANAGRDVVVIRVTSRRDVADLLDAARRKLPNAA